MCRVGMWSGAPCLALCMKPCPLRTPGCVKSRSSASACVYPAPEWWLMSSTLLIQRVSVLIAYLTDPLHTSCCLVHFWLLVPPNIRYIFTNTTLTRLCNEVQWFSEVQCPWFTGKFYLGLCPTIRACHRILLSLTQLTETDPNLDTPLMKRITLPFELHSTSHVLMWNSSPF